MLGALVVELLLLEVGLGLVDVRLCGVLGGDVGGDVGSGGGDGGLLGVDRGLGLHALHAGEDVALLHVVAFFDVEVGDAAEGGGADVDVGLGLDLAGAADGGDEILADGFAGGDLGDVGLAVEDGPAATPARTRTMTTRIMIFFMLIHSFFLNYACARRSTAHHFRMTNFVL